jgi:hypothetical protein
MSWGGQVSQKGSCSSSHHPSPSTSAMPVQKSTHSSWFGDCTLVNGKHGEGEGALWISHPYLMHAGYQPTCVQLSVLLRGAMRPTRLPGARRHGVRTNQGTHAGALQCRGRP